MLHLMAKTTHSFTLSYFSDFVSEHTALLPFIVMLPALKFPFSASFTKDFFVHCSSYILHSLCGETTILFKTLLKTSLPLQPTSRNQSPINRQDMLKLIFLRFSNAWRIRLTDSLKQQTCVLCDHSVMIIHLIITVCVCIWSFIITTCFEFCFKIFGAQIMSPHISVAFPISRKPCYRLRC